MPWIGRWRCAIRCWSSSHRLQSSGRFADRRATGPSWGRSPAGRVDPMRLLIAVLAGLIALAAAPALAQTDYASQLSEADVSLRDFRFRSGEALRELRMHYATLGAPRRDSQGRVENAVMLLHGTGGSGRQFLQPQFADELFGPGQPLDIRHYFIIMPDNVGHGRSSKPSDGLRMNF